MVIPVYSKFKIKEVLDKIESSIDSIQSDVQYDSIKKWLSIVNKQIRINNIKDEDINRKYYLCEELLELKYGYEGVYNG